VPVEVRACFTLFWKQDGLPVSEERLTQLDFLTSQLDSLRYPAHLYCAGAHAADQGLWEEHGRAIEALEELSRRSIAAGGMGRTALRYALAAQAYGLWSQGQPDAALAVLEEVKRYNATDIIRWTLVMILMDLARWEEAIPYLKADWWQINAFGHYHLARAYEQTAEHEKARKEYAFFVEAWQDADPELQPWVDDARRALERLTGDR
jgi:predicted Zn-dependent protease